MGCVQGGKPSAVLDHRRSLETKQLEIIDEIGSHLESDKKQTPNHHAKTNASFPEKHVFNPYTVYP